MTALSESKRGQMAIVLVDDIAGASTAAGIEKYGRFTEAVFDLWGVGRKDVNDGVLIAVYLEGRRIEVRTGAGARVALPDGWLEDMQHGEMVPHFRAGNPGRGVLAGATAILDRLDASSTPLEGGGAAAASVPVPTERHEFGLGRVRSRPAVQRPSERRYTYEEGSGSLPLVMFLLLNVSASVIAVNSFLEDRRRRRCRTPGCEALMDRVGSELDGQSALTPGGRWTAGPEALTACELDERRVGSVRWTLLRCAKCGAERALQEERAGFSRCSSCHCRCETEHTHTLVHATEHSTGTRKHEASCQHCGKHREWTSVIPRRENKSSSSSGGFGGGSSGGGGGAGASWLGGGQESGLDPLFPRAKGAMEAAREGWEQQSPDRQAALALVVAAVGGVAAVAQLRRRSMRRKRQRGPDW